MHPHWLMPDWPAPIGVKATFTTRSGGISPVPWDSLNLGDHVGDAPKRVADNRRSLQQALGARPVFMQQVHGFDVAQLSSDPADGLQADACWTTQRGIVCTVMVADCLPVLLASHDGLCVAAVHCGWRGLAGWPGADGQGVLEAIFKQIRAVAPANTAQAAIKSVANPGWMAWLGPCIGPAAFEVGPDVKQAFVAHQADAARYFNPIAGSKFLCDLPGLARQRLQALGVTDISGNDGSAAWCTVGNPAQFFSHRRDAGSSGNGFGTTGRMAACVWLS